MDHQAAALWLGKAANLFDVTKRPWLRNVAKAYSHWTAVANGSDLDENDDPDGIPHQWNYAYFRLLAQCFPGLTIEQIDELALSMILKLPGEAFLDAVKLFVRSVDEVYFSGSDMGDSQAVHVREALARRVMASRDWEWQLRREDSDSISLHLGRAVAALLFNEFDHFQPGKCYLRPKGIDRLGPFLPLFQEVAEKGPFLFIAVNLLNVIEVSPLPAHIGLTCAAAKSWLAAQPDSRGFWIGQAIGRRLCSTIEAIVALDPRAFTPDQPARKDVDDFLGKLVRLGVAEAHHLEDMLVQIR